ncbi:hypothetical protein Ancab_031820 [Ancistrocladus abbreviatus]
MEVVGLINTKRCATSTVAVCLLALPILLMVMDQSLKSDVFERFIKAGSVWENASTRVDPFPASKNESSQPNIATNGQPTDRLLNGLLAPGFDEGSCMSRYQSHLFQKASLHKPSPYLISKLRDYEDLHRRCAPYTKAYNTTIRRLIKSSSNNSSTTVCRYIVWKGSDGLGNRIISLASTFLYAILTNRVLLVEFWGDMMDLFCEPFPNSSWLLPKEDFFYENELDRFQAYANMSMNNDNSSIEQFWVPSFLSLDLHHLAKDRNVFHCHHSQSLLQKVPVLILLSNQYFVPSLFMIPSFKQELGQMFPEKESVFHHLGRYLFHPSNRAWGLISRFYQAYLAKADERIGLQIRVFHTNLSPPQTVMNQILACTLKYKLLPEIDKQKIVSHSLQNWKSKAVLVASLYPNYAQNLTAMYRTRPTVTGEVIAVYQPSHEEEQRFRNQDHNMKAWTEMYLLSLCDVLVTSGWSTFGYVAQSLGGIKPWILPNIRGAESYDPPCRRVLSMEPCFHFPPDYNCEANTKVLHASTLSADLRACEDEPRGVKLVDD